MLKIMLCNLEVMTNMGNAYAFGFVYVYGFTYSWIILTDE